MKITMLGTGKAVVTECYNTCFLIQNEDQLLLVDGGGGNTIFKQFKEINCNWLNIKHIFLTHTHMDHLMGILWLVRMFTQRMNKGRYEGEVFIYSNEEALQIIKKIAEMLLQPSEVAFIGKRLHLIKITDGEEKEIIGQKFTFFDVKSIKTVQFGFMMNYENGKKLTFCGDEPCHKHEEKYVKNADWLIHEAFCIKDDDKEFRPYEKNHSTVDDACILAERLGVKNLILCHTEDTNIKERKEKYTKIGQKYFHGNIFVPNDLDTISI